MQHQLNILISLSFIVAALGLSGCGSGAGDDGSDLYLNHGNYIDNSDNANNVVKGYFNLDDEDAATNNPLTNNSNGCPSGYDQVRCKVFRDTNTARKNAGLSGLVATAKCSNLAQSLAEDMDKYNKLTHLSPVDGNFDKRLELFGLNEISWGAENVYANGNEQSDGSGVVSAWLKSAEHKQNMLNKKAKKVGIGASGGYFSQCLTD